MMSSFSGSLASAMGNAYSTSLELHGEIGLSRERLLTRFQSVINTHIGREASGDDSLKFFSKLHTADLYLATACVLPSNAAWCRLATLYSNHVKRISRQVSNTVGGADEIAGNAMGYLYMPDGSGRTRIASYSGCGSLTSWVGAVVRNLARDQNLEKHRAGPLLVTNDAHLAKKFGMVNEAEFFRKSAEGADRCDPSAAAPIDVLLPRCVLIACLADRAIAVGSQYPPGR